MTDMTPSEAIQTIERLIEAGKKADKREWQAYGSYLSARAGYGTLPNVDHIDELGKGSVFTAVPFADRNNADFCAASANARPAFRELLEMVKRENDDLTIAYMVGKSDGKADLAKRLEQAEARVKEAEEMARFYESNWSNNQMIACPKSFMGPNNALWRDKGQRARDFLQSGEKQTEGRGDV